MRFSGFYRKGVHIMITPVTEERKQRILSELGPFVEIRRLESGRYGSTDYDVVLRNGIPWFPKKHELFAWCDGWNGCFGGRIMSYSRREDGDHYVVRVYID